MDETNDNGGQVSYTDAWLSARVGNAIDALVDRTLARPQMGSDAAQAYGVDQNGNLYSLGQRNAQVVAQVQTRTAGQTVSPLMLMLIIGAVVLLVSK